MNSHFIFILVMILLSAFFSGAEISIAGLSPFHYQKKHKEKIIFLLNKKDAIISTLLIGNNISIVAATLALDEFLPATINVPERAGVFVLQIIIFFFLAELLPKNLFRKLDSWILIKIFPFLIVVYYMLKPLSFFFSLLSQSLIKLFPDTRQTRSEDIVYFIRSQFAREKRPITQGIATLGKVRAVEIMTPIPEVFSINASCNVKEALVKIKGTSYSRYPVFENRGDNVLGYIKIVDLLPARLSDKISKYVFDPVYIPENIPVDKILEKMQREFIQMFFVVNEYGSVTGIITLENIAEQIVGADILAREQITEKPYILKINATRYELDGNLDIDDFNDTFGQNIEKNGFETITGFIIDMLGDIPEKGTKIKTGFGTMVVRNANKKTILSIVLTLNKEDVEGAWRAP
ncbi:MAG: hemolysin family protein [Spirochaetia bacterium]|nr:hemolysin family protein [Spirochaetia bacterium]